MENTRIENSGIEIGKVTFWQAGENIHNLVWDGDKLTKEDCKNIENKFPSGFVFMAWYEDSEGEADFYEEYEGN